MSARGETMNSAQKMSAMKKTIDSEDEDDDMVIQARNRSRTAKGENVEQQRDSSEAAQIKLLKVNVDLETMPQVPGVGAGNSRPHNTGTEVQQNQQLENQKKLTEEKDKQLQEALDDKKKLLGLLCKVKKTFDAFKDRHEDIVKNQAGMLSAGESGSTERSINNLQQEEFEQF